jgi:hypothetical protein
MPAGDTKDDWVDAKVRLEYSLAYDGVVENPTTLFVGQSSIALQQIVIDPNLSNVVQRPGQFYLFLSGGCHSQLCRDPLGARTNAKGMAEGVWITSFQGADESFNRTSGAVGASPYFRAFRCIRATTWYGLTHPITVSWERNRAILAEFGLELGGCEKRTYGHVRSRRRPRQRARVSFRSPMYKATGGPIRSTSIT